jgi:thiol-disulfide isomerase/thioredoxin
MVNRDRDMRLRQHRWRVPGGIALAAILVVAGAYNFAGRAQAEIVAPKLSIVDAANMPTPLPYPYNESVDPMAEVNAALARAEENGKRVLIDLGGNWCGWCRLLAGVMELPEMRPLMAEHFELVTVDISSAAGKIDRNLEIPERFGVEEIGGVPWMIVLAPDGAVLHSSYEVTDQNHETPQEMADWLAFWAL